MMKKGVRWMGGMALLAAFLLPLVMALISSLMCAEELGVVYSKGQAFRWIPCQVTFGGYWSLLFESEAYLSTFWNSMLIAVGSTALQLIVALIVGYALVRLNFRGKGALVFLYILLMLMPFQVTLLPNHMLSKGIGIYNTWWALILPNALAPVGVFLMREFMKGIPGEILEAAYLDTSSNLRVIASVVMPNLRAGILTVAVLAFAESWNMVEQPLILLENEWLYPLSLRLSMLEGDALDVHFSGAVLYMIPAILIYFLFKEELMEGIKQIKL